MACWTRWRPRPFLVARREAQQRMERGGDVACARAGRVDLGLGGRQEKIGLLVASKKNRKMKRDILGSATSDAPRSDVISKELKCACGSDKYSVEYFEAYGVVLCRDCKKNDPLINKVRIRNFAPISVVGETDAPAPSRSTSDGGQEEVRVDRLGFGFPRPYREAQPFENELARNAAVPRVAVERAQQGEVG